MLRQRVNGYDISTIDAGQAITLACLHSTLGDVRVCSPVVGPSSQRHRVISISLLHHHVLDVPNGRVAAPAERPATCNVGRERE